MGRASKRAVEMRRMVAEFRASGHTRREFAQQRGIAITTLDYWRQRIAPKPRLLKVEVARAAATSPSFTLRLANGRGIEIAFPLAEPELVQLIRIAERA